MGADERLREIIQRRRELARDARRDTPDQSGAETSWKASRLLKHVSRKALRQLRVL